MASTVWFAPYRKRSIARDVRRLLNAAGLPRCVAKADLVAIKAHFGERGNVTRLKAEDLRPIVDAVREAGGTPFLTDTSTLYAGSRSNGVDYLSLIAAHGFTWEALGAPAIMADGLVGRNEVEVPIRGRHFQAVPIAADAAAASVIIAATHVTGHMVSGLGGTLKNLGMGFASRRGKLRQHSGVNPFIRAERCTACGACVRWCPAGALQLAGKPARAAVDPALCIGCAECLTACRFHAIGYNWEVSSQDLQERMVEYAAGALAGKSGKCAFISFLTKVTKDCDCIGTPQKPLFPDLGTLASTDPVAIDQAALDLIVEKTGKSLAEWGYRDLDPGVQLQHAEAIGLGYRRYALKILKPESAGRKPDSRGKRGRGKRT